MSLCGRPATALFGPPHASSSRLTRTSPQTQTTTTTTTTYLHTTTHTRDSPSITMLELSLWTALIGGIIHIMHAATHLAHRTFLNTFIRAHMAIQTISGAFRCVK